MSPLIPGSMTCRIPLGRSGLFALIDEEDFDLVSSLGPWFASPSTWTIYARNDRLKGQQRMHRVILPGHTQIDHANLNGLDNRRCNLRPATTSQNATNRGAQRGSASRYKGVSRARPGSSRWVAVINKDRTRYYLGTFSSEVEAARAYDGAALELHGEFAFQNFPERAA